MRNPTGMSMGAPKHPDQMIVLTKGELQTILAAIEALKPMADVVMENERLNARIKVFESSEYQARLEGLASDVFRLQAENHELKKRPASPAPSDEGMVERVARAIWNVDAHPARKNWDEAIQSDDYAEALNDCRAYARASLAAIKEVE